MLQELGETKTRSVGIELGMSPFLKPSSHLFLSLDKYTLVIIPSTNQPSFSLYKYTLIIILINKQLPPTTTVAFTTHISSPRPKNPFLLFSIFYRFFSKNLVQDKRILIIFFVDELFQNMINNLKQFFNILYLWSKIK